MGLYDVLYTLNQRFQLKSIPRQLSHYEQSVFDKLTASIANNAPASLVRDFSSKKRLAFVSPLPPLRSGISGYSADLLPLLSEHYDVDVIVDQDVIADDWINAHCAIRTGQWLSANPSYYDRVIYHFGNSPFHEYMFDLLEKTPGLVVLHDFYLGHVAHKRYEADFVTHLYHCHGYHAVEKLHQSTSREAPIWDYPLNFNVLQNALNVIVHSANSKRLAQQFYGSNIANHWPVIPLFRTPPRQLVRRQPRANLRLNADDFIVCSFGLTGPIKLNHRLLDAWLASELCQHEQCVLIFVGENDDGEYGESLLSKIALSGHADRIVITGWVDDEHYHSYLSSADLGIQLRTRSRGETSAAVLDCMNYGLATVINANGAMADLPSDAVYKLRDDFDNSELTAALETLWHDQPQRQCLSTKAKSLLNTLHSPSSCATQYVTAIESAYHNKVVSIEPLIDDLLKIKDLNQTDAGLRTLAQSLAHAFPPHTQQRQLLIDISAIVVNDLKTGIQRVVRAQLEVLLRHTPRGFRVEPVYLSDEGGQWHFNYARRWTCEFLGLGSDTVLDDMPVDFCRGDILYCADLCTGLSVHADNSGLYQRLISSGINVYFQVFDILPILQPKWFPREAKQSHIAWAEVVARSSGALCISQAVAEEFNDWYATSHPENLALATHHCQYFHLGADIDTTAPSTGLPDNADAILTQLGSAPSFLMVGTIEPRKGQKQALAAFNLLWQQGITINLVIVGKAGWMVDSLIETISSHPKLNQHLFWLDGISDEFLTQVYTASSCLIAASEGEGFGLPLIEAAQHHLPIIARDIPVFREVAGEFAHYFSGLDPATLALSIEGWLELEAKGKAPKSIGMPWLTWQQSTAQLVQLMGLTLKK